MEIDEIVTRVVFLFHVANDDLLAFFPEDEFHSYVSETKTSYSHVGQHSACNLGYARECRLATENEYKDLKEELEGIGYNLEVSDIIYPI